MFSTRTSWDRTENSLTVAIEKARAEGRSLVDLTESNPTRADLVDLTPLLAELGHPRGAVYEPSPLGHRAAREAVAGYYRDRGIAVDPTRIVLSASTSEAYSWLFNLLADAEDNVLVPRPSYPLLSWIASSQRVHLVPYQLTRESAFRIDFDDLRRSIDERTKAIVLVHPNNPTGSFVRRGEAATLQAIAREHDLALIVDEVFGDYPIEALPHEALPSFAALSDAEAPLTLVMSGLSKVMLLPQCKLGWTVIGGAAPLVAEAIARLELIADTYLSVGTPVQLALPALLSRQPAVAEIVRTRVRQNLAALDDALASAGPSSPVRRLPLEGGWYAILEVPRIHDEDAWVALLIERDGVLVHPGYFFDLDRDGFLVVSLLPAPQPFREAILRVVQRLTAP